MVLDISVTQPGTDLGESPSSPFEPEPRQIEIDAAVVGIEREVTSLLKTFSELSPNEWHSTVTLDGAKADPHGIFATRSMTRLITFLTWSTFA